MSCLSTFQSKYNKFTEKYYKMKMHRCNLEVFGPAKKIKKFQRMTTGVSFLIFIRGLVRGSVFKRSFFLLPIVGGQLAVSCIRTEKPDDRWLPTIGEVMQSKSDLWGEAAMGHPDGISYDFFKDLLPPPRYVNADFRYYPIVLSAPNAPVKARLISNGSGLNLKGGTKSWKDVGFPFVFRVGTDEFLFGGLNDRLSEPVLAEGWLPVPEICYLHGTPYQSEGMVPLDQKKQDMAPEIYRLEAFAATDSTLAGNGVVFVKFDLKQGNNGFVTIDPGDDSTLMCSENRLINEKGKILAVFDDSWIFNRNKFRATLGPGTHATFAIATNPLRGNSAFRVHTDSYYKHRAECVKTWKDILKDGMQVITPDSLVNHACKNSVCQIFQLINGNEIRYSSGNQYDKMYEAEGSDVAGALLVTGFEKDMKRCLLPLFKFTRKGLELHHASFKIRNLCKYYWYSNDSDVISDLRPFWEKEAVLLDTGRTGPGGLYPEEQYCGDIHTFVQSLNVNSQAWKAMRDLGSLLRDIGKEEEAKHYLKEAANLRKIVLEAVSRVTDKSVSPPFVPVALNGGEPVHDPILHSRIGSYWNIIIGYTIGSGIFPPGSEEERWIPEFIEQHGGLCMGMLRSGGGSFNFWTGDQRVNPLYGTRYSLHTLFRDQPERALVSFYGMLAQGLTRNTFIGGEGASLQSVDNRGRFFYCPPNSAASAHLLSMFRNLLVQDWDMDDDGKPETLRLAFATPRGWLENGKEIVVKNAPTAFGLTSYRLKADLENERVNCFFIPPPRRPGKSLIRIRVPDHWQVLYGETGGQKLAVDENGTADVSVLTEPCEIQFHLSK